MSVGLCRVSVGLEQPYTNKTLWQSIYCTRFMKSEGLATKFFRAQAHSPTQAAWPRLRHGCSHSAKGLAADCQSDDRRLP